jgi:hypothetical protein
MRQCAVDAAMAAMHVLSIMLGGKLAKASKKHWLAQRLKATIWVISCNVTGIPPHSDRVHVLGVSTASISLILYQTSLTSHLLGASAAAPFLGSIPDWQDDGATQDGPIYDDDLSSLREKLFIDFSHPMPNIIVNQRVGASS